GAAGEQLARHHLEQQGYEFIAANWRRPYGELDLIMRDGDVLVFVEVKTRRSERFGSAEESVSPSQVARLLRAAESFLTEQPALAGLFWRVDLVAVTLAPSGVISRLTHIVDAIHTR
ncbi:MAG TPA: YraN family protein, partial [Gemmatimonadales bacterium]|nr:YraN family protein [Gemmatimonadales bacterium]